MIWLSAPWKYNNEHVFTVMNQSTYFGEVKRETVSQGHVENTSKGRRYELSRCSIWKVFVDDGWLKTAQRNTCELELEVGPRGL